MRYTYLRCPVRYFPRKKHRDKAIVASVATFALSASVAIVYIDEYAVSWMRVDEGRDNTTHLELRKEDESVEDERALGVRFFATW